MHGSASTGTVPRWDTHSGGDDNFSPSQCHCRKHGLLPAHCGNTSESYYISSVQISAGDCCYSTPFAGRCVLPRKRATRGHFAGGGTRLVHVHLWVPPMRCIPWVNCKTCHFHFVLALQLNRDSRKLTSVASRRQLAVHLLFVCVACCVLSAGSLAI